MGYAKPTVQKDAEAGDAVMKVMTT